MDELEKISDAAWLNRIKDSYESLPFPPSHFWTFTFEKEPSESRARHYVKRYFQLLAKVSDVDLFCLSSIGVGDNTRIHSHGVLFVEDFNKIQQDFKWAHGLQEWSAYDCSQGGIIYSIYGGRRKHSHYPFQMKAYCRDLSRSETLTKEIERALLVGSQRNTFTQ
jgi:hypothetical protein